MQEIARRFKERGAPSVAVTASTKSKDFFERLRFGELTYAVFMVADSVGEVVVIAKHYSKNS